MALLGIVLIEEELRGGRQLVNCAMQRDHWWLRGDIEQRARRLLSEVFGSAG